MEFTPEQQDYVNKLVVEAKHKERERFSDYDELKTKITNLEKTGQNQLEELEKVRGKLASTEETLKSEQETRLKAERTALLATVEAETGVKARYLSGSTVEELKASAEEYKADAKSLFGAEVPARSVDSEQAGGVDPTVGAKEWAQNYLGRSN